MTMYALHCSYVVVSAWIVVVDWLKKKKNYVEYQRTESIITLCKVGYTVFNVSIILMFTSCVCCLNRVAMTRGMTVTINSTLRISGKIQNKGEINETCRCFPFIIKLC